MSSFKWETSARVVVERRIAPFHSIVAHHTVCGKLSLRMRRIGSGVVVFQVTRNAFRTHGIESKSGARLMALIAIYSCMALIQRKTRQTVNFIDVANQPRIRIVTTFTILTQRFLMHIRMARNAIRFGIRKNQRCMATSASNILMLSYQLKGSRIVVESLFLNFPVFGGMANITTYLQSITMRRLP